jgi:hypothetical protein
MKAAIENRICDGLIELTKAIAAIDTERVAHGFLGGEHGYGAHWQNDVFEMRPYYWGECTCNADQREREWCDTHHHAPECYQSELKARLETYDRESGYAEIDRAAFGGDHLFGGMDVESDSPMPGVVVMMGKPRKDAAMESWRKAHDKRRKFEDALYDELCAKFKLNRRLGCAVHCTCDRERQWLEWAPVNGHTPECLLELPNFHHKPSGMRVDWYKYIGRGMEAKNAPESIDALNAIFRECIASLDKSPAEINSEKK